MSKKPKIEEVEEEEVAPFWMISFSDLMTLLLSFFIILFSISTIETQKMAAFMESMGGRYLRGNQHSGNKALHTDPNLPKSKVLTSELPGKSFQSIVQFQDEKTLGTIIPFSLRNDQLDDNAKAILLKLADQLRGTPFLIIVKGNASKKEVSSYHNVDDLAYSRAWSVREYLLTLDLEPERFVLLVAGYSSPLNNEQLQLLPQMDNPNTYVEIIQTSAKPHK